MSRRALAILLLAGAAAIAGTLRLRGEPQEPSFPHERHARLFPVCAGCHQGIPTGDRAAFYPAPALCANCHDGQRQRRVEWTGPHRVASNVVFSHPAHESSARGEGDTVSCQQCHTTTAPGGPAPTPGAAPSAATRMAVARARPELCIRCHAHAAPSHLAMTARCTACHVTLARAAAVPADTVAAFPKPETHASRDFILTHGRTATVAEARARCAICHARESCARCHPNAAQVPAIAALEPDRRMATIVANLQPSWPLPPNHRDPGWLQRHGAAAEARPTSCANCHTQTGCRSCHTGEGANAVIAALPLPGPGGPVGALAVRTAGGAVPGRVAAVQGSGRPLAEVPIADAAAPPTRNRVHPAGFATRHGSAAATDDPSCSSCHQQTFCGQCHRGSTRPVFHPPAYLERHASDVYAGATECTSCHSNEAFCRACHRGAGLQAQGRTDVAFHTGQPLWLLQHGQAARQGLEGCATCHAQQTCLGCHSTITRQINPHGPGFDAARMRARSPLMCDRCHVGDPLAR